jgi:hypothetical protein
MPLHSSSRGADGSRTKTKSAAGGAVSVAGTRSAVTGHKVGRAAARAIAKNADNAEEYLEAVESAVSLADLQELGREHTLIARVERNPGGGHLKVTLQTGEAAMDVSITGTLRFRGAAAKKTDRPNCFCANDIIIVDAGLAVSKLSSAQIARVRRVFSKHGLDVPRGFFSAGDAFAAAEEEDFEFDRSDEERAEAEAAAEAAAARARSLLLKKQAAAGRGPRLNTGRNQDAVTAALDAEVHAAEERRRREEEDAADFLLDAAAAVAAAAAAAGGGGPSRAERRAAQRAAAEKDADEAELFDLYGAAAKEALFDADVVLPNRADKSWDEVDVDAI